MKRTLCVREESRENSDKHGKSYPYIYGFTLFEMLCWTRRNRDWINFPLMDRDEMLINFEGSLS